MREFEYVFDQGLLSGVRTSSRSRMRGQQVIEAYNMRVSEDGLEPYKSIEFADSFSNPVTPSDVIDITDTSPLIFNNSIITLVFGHAGTDAKLYFINENGDLILTKAGIGSGELTSCADFGEFAVLAGELGMIEAEIPTGYGSHPHTTFHTGTFTMPHVATCCNFRGQFIGGNVLSDWGDWESLGSTYVVYSDIGSINMTPGQSNIAGNVYIPTPHDIVKVLSLRDHVIVYTTGDIWALTPVVDPAPTFKLTPIANVGILNPLAAAGNEHNHVIVDHLGLVWIIDETLKPKKLGYKEFFQDYASEIMVVFDPATDEWRINCNGGAYLLTKFGLSTCYQRVSGICYNDSYYWCIGTESSDRCGRIVTDAMDFGYRGIKTIHGVELDIDNAQRVTVGIDRRFNQSGKFKRSRQFRLNSLGQMAVPQSGTDFRAVVEFSDYRNAELDYIKLRYKMSDMRGLRGVYSPKPRGQYAG